MDAKNFLNYLNKQHSNIKFTIEFEKDKNLAFLDVLIDNGSGKTITSVFRKATFTGLLTNFLSFTLYSYKINRYKGETTHHFSTCIKNI